MTGHEQIDCILHEGKGEPIPYTDKVKVPVKSVLAVFEIKKTLYSSEVQEGIDQLKSVADCMAEEFQQGGRGTIDVSPALRAFAQMTGVVAPDRSSLHSLPAFQQMLYHALICEHVEPLRIIFGYHGFAGERTFRTGFRKLLEGLLNTHGYGPRGLPHLITSGRYSLIKLNGQPYVLPHSPETWAFYGSSSQGYGVFLLELLWTRIARRYNIEGLFGQDLTLEPINLFLLANLVKQGTQTGWNYQYISLSAKELSYRAEPLDWEPVYLNLPQFVVMNALCHGPVSTADGELRSYIETNRYDFEEFLDSMTSTGLVARESENLVLITDKCGCLIHPDFGYLAAENNTGQLTRWLKEHPAKGSEKP